MTDKELIKQEIERRMDLYSIAEKDDSTFARMGELSSLIDFIDSLTEEPKCIYNRTLEERKKSCKYCSAACNVRIEEEPVSEDLYKEIKSWIPAHIEGGDEYLRAVSIQWSEIVARHFAEWQKQQMNDALQTEYEKGQFNMREEMMKDAVEAEVFTDYNINFGYGSLTANIDLDEQHLKEGDKVKIIIIKPEQQ